MGFRSCAELALACALTLGPSRAALAAPAARSAAAAVERGISLMKAGNYKEALAEFLEAHQAAPGPRTTAQIAQAEHALARWLDAELHYQEALADRHDRWVKQHRAQIEKLVAAVRAHLGTVDIGSPQPPPRDAVVRVNGDVAGGLPVERPVRVVAGAVTVEAAAPGYETFRAEVTVAAGSTVRVDVRLARSPTAQPSAASSSLPPSGALAASRGDGDSPTHPDRQPARSLAQSWAAATLVTLGVAGLLAGGYALYLDGRPTCAPSPSACPTVHDTRKGGRLLVGAGASAAVGGTLLIAF